MTIYEQLNRIGEIYSRLQDEESRNIFEAKLSLMVNGNQHDFWKKIKGDKKWCSEVLTDEAYFIFGAGVMGRYIKDVIDTSGRRVVCFLDNDKRKIGNVIDGTRVESVEYASNYPNVKIIVSNRIFSREMKRQLKDLGITNEVLEEEVICSFSGKQYFDVFEPENDEVFIDAGAYDGGTIKDFIEWCGEKEYKKIYSFEPDPENYRKCKEYADNDSTNRVVLINKGTYNQETELQFANWGTGGSHITEDKGISVPVTSIDKVLMGQKASYIKMDVEGSEKATLEGARKTITQYKPRLAVCVYHKSFDFIELPLLLIDWNPNYRFYLRHYASNLCETVLYVE